MDGCLSLSLSRDDGSISLQVWGRACQTILIVQLEDPGWTITCLGAWREEGKEKTERYNIDWTGYFFSFVFYSRWCSVCTHSGKSCWGLVNPKFVLNIIGAASVCGQMSENEMRLCGCRMRSPPRKQALTNAKYLGRGTKHFRLLFPRP